MLARTRDRLEALEAKIAPKAKAFVFISFDAGEPGAPYREDRLAPFKAEHHLFLTNQGCAACAP
jgi:hypothetical protein